ncbi:aquaporin-5-like [Babylonia areolata]|uniref:aquaporin-5-like n=1 Tax=Babylonia areolata TaxID=304850 RepID=UPI003FD0C63D
MWKIMKDNLEDLLSPNLWRSLACETVGTMFIVLLGCGAWIQAPPPGVSPMRPDVVQISLAFGLAVATMLWVFAHISGGHFNPALTLATLATRRVSIVRGLLYIVAQVLGGILGAGVLYGLTPVERRGMLGATLVSVQPAQAFGVELLVTFVFVLSYFASRDSERQDVSGSYPLTVGLAVVVCHLFAISFTGAGMNCARSFGPAVIMDMWENHWVYWVGPLTGGLLAGLLYDYIFSAGATVAKAQKCLLRTKRPTTAPISSKQEKVPLDESRAAPEVIEIDEKEAAVVTVTPAAESEKEAAAADAAATTATDVDPDPPAITTDSDKAKLTENAGKE